MMAYKEIVATLGMYEKGGQRKYITRKVGTLLETDKGMRIKLDAIFNPAGCRIDEDGSIWLAVFDPKPREEAVNSSRDQLARQQPKHTQQFSDMPRPNIDNFDDDLPIF